jgi:hypothetical protein
MDAIEKLKKLYDNEINFLISCFWDAGYSWKLGDETNGFKGGAGCYDSLEETIDDLFGSAQVHYPGGNFKISNPITVPITAKIKTCMTEAELKDRLIDEMRDNQRQRVRIEELAADIAFLSRRSIQAGSCSFTDERDSGTSSNSIVATAYGLIALDLQVLPGDGSDLAACEKMWEKLPEHRKIFSVRHAMERARNYRDLGKEGSNDYKYHDALRNL